MLFRIKAEQSIPLIYENGTRNLSIAMVMAITTFRGEATLGVAACILSQFPVAALFYAILRRSDGGYSR